MEEQENRLASNKGGQYFSGLVDMIPLIIWVTDGQGFAEFFNARWTELTGLSPEESFGMGWQKAIHPDDRMHDYENWMNSIATGKVFYSEHRLLTKEGNYLWTMCRAVPVYESGLIVKWIGSNVDISDRRILEEELRQAKEAAEEANRAKSAFLANMSHEIRTPLNAIMGFSSFLREEDLSPEDKASFLDVIHRNGESLSVLIDDVLDLSKVEAGKLHLEAIPMSLTSVVADVTASLSRAAQQKGIGLTSGFSPQLPKVIMSDPTRLRQVLMNIVSNAIKFTERGRVDVYVDVQLKQDDKSSRVTFTISDTGCGISDQARPRLFMPFSQADNSTTRQHGGTGLGLILARRLARLLGGDVVLTSSRLGQGSVFTVSIEAHPPQGRERKARTAAIGQAEAAVLPISLQGVRILLAEDIPDNQDLIKLFLEKHGAQVTIADNGRAALTLALAHGFDIILMDVQMPELDGYEVVLKLRRQGYNRPIIFLTAYAMQEHREKCLKLGADAFLTKPISMPNLLATLDQVFPKTALLTIEGQ